MPHQIVQTSVQIAGKNYTVTIEANSTITDLVVNPATLHFETSGPDGTIGYINVTIPADLNKTAIKVFVDGNKLEPPPFPIITTNSTHYFIYFEFVQSTHNMTIQYAIADIAITSVTPSKTVVGQGYSLDISVTATNQGNYTETFYVLTYISPSQQNRTLTLESGASTTFIVTFYTASIAKGNYTLGAYAHPVPGEIDTADNTLTDGWFIVAMVGDITGPTPNVPDGKVDIRDLALIAKYYGKIGPFPIPIANCDITGPTLGVPDGKIDIRDIALAAKNYGKIDP